MHGIIFNQLFKFVRESQGSDVLNEIKKGAGLVGKFYDATKPYPDSELMELVVSACKVLQIDKDLLLEEFGKFIAPGLIKTYKPYIKEEWDCMDLLEHIENTIHRIVRHDTPEATPPILLINRTKDNEVVIKYTSNRHMVSLGIGIIKAMAEHFNENITIVKTPTKDGMQLKVGRSQKNELVK